ncbi:E2 ubiquitin-protein ligase peroxin 4, partial [Spiromyces aspiralis]
MSSATKRLIKELGQIHHDGSLDPLVTLSPVSDEDLFTWKALLNGPPDTPYEGGVFELLISIPDSYPIQPPSLKFLTTVCHPNVKFDSGEICLDILKDQWSPAWTIKSTCLAISLLLSNPEPSSPLNCDVANLLRCGDRIGYDSL